MRPVQFNSRTTDCFHGRERALRSSNGRSIIPTSHVAISGRPHPAASQGRCDRRKSRSRPSKALTNSYRQSAGAILLRAPKLVGRFPSSSRLSVQSRIPIGCAHRGFNSTLAVSYLPAAMQGKFACRLKRAAAACSRSAMCAQDRSNGSRRRLAMARKWWRRSTDIWPVSRSANGKPRGE